MEICFLYPINFGILPLVPTQSVKILKDLFLFLNVLKLCSLYITHLSSEHPLPIFLRLSQSAPPALLLRSAKEVVLSAITSTSCHS